jgi:alpha-tubulin suppressor-like RCC1 family protein
MSPLPVQGGFALASLSVGGTHTCGLTAEGTAYCWGANAAGQLGVGDNVASSAVPLPVSGGIVFASISAGESHTCGLTPNGVLYCWGWNLEGELGDGSGRALSATPNRIAADHVFLAVSAGGLHTCAVDTAHDLYCWGLNANGQLGIGPSGPTIAPTPQRVAGSLAFAKISLGNAHSCAATTAGVWYCWGQNDNGQLGVGHKGEASPVPLKVLGQP